LGAVETDDFNLKELPTPRDIKAHLDEYVIGQDDAKDLAVTSTAKASNYPDDGSVAKIVKQAKHDIKYVNTIKSKEYRRGWKSGNEYRSEYGKK